MVNDVFVRVFASLMVVRVPFCSIRLRVRPFELMLMIAGSRRLCMWSVYGNSHNWDIGRCHRVCVRSVDANAALTDWMHHVRADLAGCYETSDCWMVRLGWFVT